MLLATDKLTSGPFKESIVYLIKHDVTGAFGLVINRPSDKAGVFLGGPVAEDRQVILHTPDVMTTGSAKLPDPNNDLAVSEEDAVPLLLDMIAKGNAPRKFRLIQGYTGWGPGQMEGEMRRGHWVTAPYDEEIVFAPYLGDH